MNPRNFIGIPILGIGVAIALWAAFGANSGPIMTCDPATQLQSGMHPQQVKDLCGEPASIRETDTDWYPLRGDTRENKRKDFAWQYGSITSRSRNVNLYFRKGVLDSVQIFGDYK